MHFFQLLILTVFKPPEDSFTSGLLASMYSSFAAEDSIHGSITDVKIKVLNCIMVSW